MAEYIELTDIHKSFGEKHVLAGFNMSVAKGQSMVIIGGSGSGKSVTIKVILGLLYPDAGEITVDGNKVLSMTAKERAVVNKQCGMLFQHAALFDSLLVWENIAFPLVEGLGMGRREAYNRALETLAQVGMPAKVAQQYPVELSGGMQKRIGLARAIAARPKILFFDEPTTGLDPIMGHVIDDLIISCVRDLGATAITITHDLDSARRIADNVTMLYQGKDVWHGPVADMDKAKHPVLAQFITGSLEGPIAIGASN